MTVLTRWLCKPGAYRQVAADVYFSSVHSSKCHCIARVAHYLAMWWTCVQIHCMWTNQM